MDAAAPSNESCIWRIERQRKKVPKNIKNVSGAHVILVAIALRDWDRARGRRRAQVVPCYPSAGGLVEHHYFQILFSIKFPFPGVIVVEQIKCHVEE